MTPGIFVRAEEGGSSWRREDREERPAKVVECRMWGVGEMRRSKIGVDGEQVSIQVDAGRSGRETGVVRVRERIVGEKGRDELKMAERDCRDWPRRCT